MSGCHSTFVPAILLSFDVGTSLHNGIVFVNAPVIIKIAVVHIDRTFDCRFNVVVQICRWNVVRDDMAGQSE